MAASVLEGSSEVDAGGAAGDPVQPRVEVFGIRHHGPGSARSVLAALEAYQPDAVLIEGPADADPLLGLAVSDGMEPPLALLGYVSDEPSAAAFWPYAVFSPEWQALLWALHRSVEVSFCDLPASLVLAQPREPGRRARRTERVDPLAALAAAAGYDDAERWWDDVVESRLDGASPFPALLEAMTELRRDTASVEDAESQHDSQHESQHEARREAYMRSCIRNALKSGRRRVAVVCGAWHAPALTLPLPPASRDAATLRGAPKRKVTLTWVPWTHERLATASGYGAGITSPGWYHHLWSTPDQPVTRWLTKVAGSLRQRDLAVSSAHVIEAVRLAETLATLRLRPLAGLSEVTDATRAVLCEGDELAVRFVTDQLVVGQALGSVSDAVPTVPLDADLQRRCRSLRIRREAEPRVHDLDLRKTADQDKSKLFHRLRLLELDWVRPVESGIASRGTFRETWQSQWRPEHAVALVVASVYGTTVESAAAAKVAELSETATLPELTATVELCLRAELPTALTRLLGALSARAALDADVAHLMDALPALARARRYGDVRGTDTSALGQVCSALVLRICTGLPQAVSSLDEDSATGLRRRVDAVHTAIGLLTGEAVPGLRAQWLDTLALLLDRPDVNGELLGRFVRLLFDAELLTDVDVRLHRALSHGAPARAKAAWVDGFFADGALLLIHDRALRGLLDDWVGSLGDDEFVDVLPLVRRTFGSFSPSERRSIAGKLAGTLAGSLAGNVTGNVTGDVTGIVTGDVTGNLAARAAPDAAGTPRQAGAADAAEAEQELDLQLAAPALATVALLLGRVPSPPGRAP